MLVCVMIAIKMKYGCYSAVQWNRITYFYMRKHNLLLAEGVISVWIYDSFNIHTRNPHTHTDTQAQIWNRNTHFDEFFFRYVSFVPRFVAWCFLTVALCI